MAKRLTDKKKKMMVADYAEMGSYCAVARKHKVSATTVKKIVLNDPQSVEECNRKKEQNTLDMLEYLDTRTEKAKMFVDRCMDELLKDGRLEAARISEITTAFGTVVDKFSGVRQMRENALSKLDKLIEGINDAAKPETERVLERAAPPLEHKARRDEDGENLP